MDVASQAENPVFASTILALKALPSCMNIVILSNTLRKDSFAHAMLVSLCQTETR